MTIHRVAGVPHHAQNGRTGYVPKWTIMGQVISIDRTIEEETFDEPEVREPPEHVYVTCSHEEYLAFIEIFNEEVGLTPRRTFSPRPRPRPRTCPPAPKPPYITTFRQTSDRKTKSRRDNTTAQNWPNDAALREAGYPLPHKRGLGINTDDLQRDTLVTTIHPRYVEILTRVVLYAEDGSVLRLL